jgi:hypothetical protein
MVEGVFEKLVQERVDIVQVGFSPMGGDAIQKLEQAAVILVYPWIHGTESGFPVSRHQPPLKAGRNDQPNLVVLHLQKKFEARCEFLGESPGRLAIPRRTREKQPT